MPISKTKSIIIILLLFSLSSAQLKFSDNQNKTSYLKTDFSKQNTTWNWLARFSMSNDPLSTIKWNVRDQFQSNLITPTKSRNQWKDEHKLEGNFYKQFTHLNYGLYTDSWILVDKQQTVENEFSNHAAGFFVKYKPTNNLFLQPYTGYQRSKNITQTDWGWDIGLIGKAQKIDLGDYQGNFSGSSEYDFFDKRQNYNNKIETRISTRFSPVTYDSLKISYEESIKQFYNASGEDLIEVRLYNRNIKNNLIYNFSPRTLLSFETNILSKNVSYFTQRDVFFLENRFRLWHFGNEMNYSIDFRTNDETFDNNGTITDSRTRQSALGFMTEYLFNSHNKVDLQVDYVKLQYDTPDENNNDDRDEQRIILNLGYYRRISPVLSLRLDVYGFLYHQIYLFNEQSINNNWNRVIKIEPQLNYLNKNIKNRFTTSIIANYTAYDFENRSLQTRSFLSRKYAVTDSLFMPIYKYFSLGFQGRLELEEKGNFFEKSFSQNLIQSYTSRNFNFYFTQELYQKIKIRLGYSVYSRTEWRHIPVKRKNREISNQGPFLNFIYNVAQRLSVSAYTAINYYNDSKSQKASYSTGYLKLLYNL